MPPLTPLSNILSLFRGKPAVTGSADQQTFEALEVRLRAILPEEYQDHYEDVQPVSMGSASLKYGSDGKVAWGEIWDTYCDLAMAGGPPHKGKLLEPGTPEEIESQSDRYREVVEEICRGIRLTTDLTSAPSPTPGWVRVDCETRVTAEWLVRAIVMENVSARFEDSMLYLPAGPAYRVEKEIKNVITAISKTCHYWLDHTLPREQRAMGILFEQMERESPLLLPHFSDNDALRAKIGEGIQEATGLAPSTHRYAGWAGVECSDVRPAIWMMRAMVASNVLSRREDTVLFLPVNPDVTAVVGRFTQVHSFATARGVL